MSEFSQGSGPVRSRKTVLLVIVILVVAALGGIFWKYYEAMRSLAPASTNSETGSATEPTQPKASIQPLAESAESALAFSPEKLVTTVEKTFSLDVVTHPGKNRVSGAELHIKYDPLKLKLVEIKPSAMFSLELQPAKIDQSKGEGSIAIATQLDKPSLNETQTVATLSFIALKSSDSSVVEFLNTSLLSADNESRNVLKTRIPAQVTIEEK